MSWYSDFIDALLYQFLFWFAAVILLAALIGSLIALYWYFWREPQSSTAVAPIGVVLMPTVAIPNGSVEPAQPKPIDEEPPAYNEL